MQPESSVSDPPCSARPRRAGPPPEGAGPSAGPPVAPVQIRRFRPADLAAVVALGRAVFPMDALSGLEVMRIQRRCFDSFAVAEWDGALAGYIITRREPQRHGFKAHILSLAVDPAYQRRAVGRTLVAWTVAHLQSHDLTVWELEVRPTNTPGLRFWESVGFRPVRTQPRYYRDHADAVIMQRPPP